MGGVDLSDMAIYMFLEERRTIRWNTKVFFTLLARLILNGFTLYQQNTNHQKKTELMQLYNSICCAFNWGLLTNLNQTWKKGH